MDPAVDQCSDWEHAPSSGAFLLACNQDELTGYLASGLERPGPSGLRIDVTGAHARPGPVTVPAMRRDPREPSLDAWRVTATQATTAEIYAACQAGDGYLEARFRGVAVRPEMPLRVDTRNRQAWRLRDPEGRVVAAPVDPTPITPLGAKGPQHGCATK